LPGFVPLLILFTTICLISSSAERFRVTIASTVVLAITALFGFLEIRSRIADSEKSYRGLIERGESGWAEIWGMGSWNLGGWISLSTGVLLVVGGSIAGIMRERDKSEANGEFSVRQFAAALLSICLGLSVAVPLFRHAGDIAGYDYDFSVAILPQSNSVAAVIFLITAIACLLTGKGILRGLCIPGLVAGVAGAMYVFNQDDSDFTLTSAGFFSVFGTSVMLIGISLWDYLSPVEGFRDRDQSPGQGIQFSGGSYLFSAAIWGWLILDFLGNSNFQWSVLVVACCAFGFSFSRFLQKTPVFSQTNRITQYYSLFSYWFCPLELLFFLITVSYLYSIQEVDLAMIGITAGFLFLLGFLIDSGFRANRGVVMIFLVIFMLTLLSVGLVIYRDGFQTLRHGFVLIGLGALQAWVAWIYRKLPRWDVARPKDAS
jgi:hypothetical protein